MLCYLKKMILHKRYKKSNIICIRGFIAKLRFLDQVLKIVIVFRWDWVD